jgi:hypothetical protein
MDRRDELSRPSTWVLAFALGCLATAVAISGDLEAGRRMHWLWYPMRGLTVWAATLALAHGGMGLLRGLLLVLESLPPPAPKAEPVTTTPAPAPAPRPVAYNVNGQARTLELVETRTEQWEAWNDGCWNVVAWWEITRSLTAEKLAPAFKDRTAWVDFTNELEKQGLVFKDRKGTIWRVPVGAVKARLKAGSIEWPNSHPPRVTPCPTVAARAVVDAE